MPFVKSLSVGVGDMCYITHTSDNFTIIDCHLVDDDKDTILKQVKNEASEKGVTRFISTHPDEDDIGGLKDLDETLKIVNFYCVENEATKEDPSGAFKHYCKLRDGEHAYYIEKGCKRRWMNDSNDERGAAGLHILWPDPANADYKKSLKDAKDGAAFNNMSAMIRYNAANNVKMVWLGDLETAFMEAITDHVTLEKTHIVFAPHHGRKSGKIPDAWLDKLEPHIIVIGEAPSRYLHYYGGYKKITQSKAKHITFDMADANKVHIYSSENDYKPAACKLDDEKQNKFANNTYVGTLNI